MVNKKTALVIGGLLIAGAAFYISASTAFMALVLGLLFIPPALMISAALVQGILLLTESHKTENEEMVISV